MAIQFDDTDTATLVRPTRAQRAPSAPKLADTIPPVEPPATPRLAQPKAHELVRWHRDPHRVTKVKYETKESAIEAAGALDAVVYYRWAVVCGREEVAKQSLNYPTDIPAMPPAPSI